MRDNGPVAKPITLAGALTIPVGISATVYTDHFVLTDLDQFTLSYIVACTGTPNLKIELEQSIVVPTANAVDANSVVPDNFSPVVTSITTKTQHHIVLSPAATEFGRFKLTETTGTVTDTVVTLSLSTQRKTLRT